MINIFWTSVVVIVVLIVLYFIFDKIHKKGE